MLSRVCRRENGERLNSYIEALNGDTRRGIGDAAMFENCCIGRHVALSKMYYTIGLSIKSERRKQRERADRFSSHLYLAFVIVRVLKRHPRWRRILSLSRGHDGSKDFTKIQELTCASLILRAGEWKRLWNLDCGRSISERGRERERACWVSLCLKKKKRQKKIKVLSFGERICEIGELLSCRGYRRWKIVHTFQATRVSRGFKRLSRLTLSPGQFKLLLFLRVCVGHIFAWYLAKDFWYCEIETGILPIMYNWIE